MQNGHLSLRDIVSLCYSGYGALVARIISAGFVLCISDRSVFPRDRSGLARRFASDSRALPHARIDDCFVSRIDTVGLESWQETTVVECGNGISHEHRDGCLYYTGSKTRHPRAGHIVLLNLQSELQLSKERVRCHLVE